MSKIFISYRRNDSHSITGRIVDRLKDHFKTEEVFMDVEKIPPGVNFLDFTNQRLQGSEVVIPIIGTSWAKTLKDRESESDDFVRIEIEEAIKHRMPIIPVLVEGATMPKADDLPASIKQIVYHNSLQVRPDPDFEADTNKLIDFLKETVSLDALKPKEKSKTAVSDKLKYLGIGAVVLLALLTYLANRETCDYPKTGVLIADFQKNDNDGFANSVLTMIDASLLDSLYDVRAVGFQARDKQNYEQYVAEEFFGTICTPNGIFVNGFLSTEQEVFNLYTSFVNLSVGMPEYLNDNSLVLSNPSNIQFSIKEDAKYISELLISIIGIHEGRQKESLETLSKLYTTAGDNDELKANISFFKGQCYALNGDEKRAVNEYKKAQKTNNQELKTISSENMSKTDLIKQSYLKEPDTAKIRMTNIKFHQALENEILKFLRRTIRGNKINKILGI
ncbi:toll/interleukin-1 receptor domain-containing protein [Arcticibacterium luteifluviistationis]|uniref:TIR domain-containing protein n=1 Tax=Arcticibacterium luteifluviistationis TaxID=1784714 RepID=A0A2Z4G9D1_9BACT|nr:toll/interleukin-1 receptor domain-containing protein [Arcticibacterium luteifluviistationis]AWV97695.1 hypothetical protein DJ013_05750 [Arcticibacterium luteifluviistationis]